MLNTDSMTMTELGNVLGYPECCVDFFIQNCGFNREWTTYINSNPFSGTGFISCPRCSENYERTKKFIELHRHPSLPKFPEFN